MSALFNLLGRRRAPWAIGALIACSLIAGALLGTASASSDPTPVPVTITPAQPVYLVHNGDTAHAAITLTTSGGVALDRPVTVNYQTGGMLTVGSGSAARTLDSTAVAGSDYNTASGSITFPAGTASGTTMSFDVATLRQRTPSEAKTIITSLSTTDTATRIANFPTVVIDAHGLPYLNASLPISQRVSDLLSRMSVAEKVGQMTQADRTCSRARRRPAIRH